MKDIIVKEGRCTLVGGIEEDVCIFDSDSGYKITDCDFAEMLYEQKKRKIDCKYWSKETILLCPCCGEKLKFDIK